MPRPSWPNLHQEPGAEVVAEVLAQDAHISVVNLVEVLSKLAERGQSSEEAYDRMVKRGLLGGMLEIHPLLPEECAAFHQRSRAFSRRSGFPGAWSEAWVSGIHR